MFLEVSQTWKSKLKIRTAILDLPIRVQEPVWESPKLKYGKV